MRDDPSHDRIGGSVAAGRVTSPLRLQGIGSFRKLVVLRLLLTRLVDELDELGRLNLDDSDGQARARGLIGDALMLALIATEELEPIEAHD
jgi:hypothetical protein